MDPLSRKKLSVALNQFDLRELRDIVTFSGERYDRIVGEGSTQPEAITDIIDAASNTGWSAKLVQETRDMVETKFDVGVNDLRGQLLQYLTDVETSLASQQALGAALSDPFDTCYVLNGQPYVNRPNVREAFKALAGKGGPRIIVVNGDPGTGKSYSRELPSFVADIEPERNLHLFYIDFSQERYSFTPQKLVERILLKWGLDPGIIPVPYQQPSGVAYELASWLIPRVPPNQEWWLILDGLAKITPDPGLADLVHALAAEIADTDRRVRLILLDFQEDNRWSGAVSRRSRPVSLMPLTCSDLVQHFFLLAQKARQTSSAAGQPTEATPWEAKANLALQNAMREVNGRLRPDNLPEELLQVAREMRLAPEG